MRIFRDPTPADREWVEPLLRREGIPQCTYNFTNMFCWQGTYGTQIARDLDRVLVRFRHSALGLAYLWPTGKGNPLPSLNFLEEDARSQGQPLRFIGLSLYHRNWLEDCWPHRFTFTEVRDSFDYLYSIDRLADLPGKKLQAKRNHINRLNDNCPGWDFSPFTDADAQACLAMDKLWRQEALARSSEEELRNEHEALTLAIQHREELGLEGVVLRWEDEILGFTLGSLLTDTVFDVHFEKARADIQGAFPAVNRSFARYLREKYPNLRYLDREEDMGIEGLRKAKLSYGPDHLQVNICAVEAAPLPSSIF
ncbi:MAG: DUF2156 domain-containing protein [Ruminiclostridium sp.]|nr:DUF2156 domain-containing protein [Ruminiclostridium sp.]